MTLKTPSSVVLDTHAWVWWVSEPARLTPRAAKLVDTAASARTLYVSSISAWEVALLVRKDRLRLTMAVEDWVAKSETLPFLQFVPVDNAIALKSAMLPDFPHPDPADRIVAATALTLGAVLVTKDQTLLGYAPLRTAW